MWLASPHLTLSQEGLWGHSIHQCLTAGLLRGVPACWRFFLAVYSLELLEEDAAIEKMPWFQWIREVPGLTEATRSHLIPKSKMDVITKIGIRHCVIIRVAWSRLHHQWPWLDNFGFLGWSQMVSPLRSYLICIFERGQLRGTKVGLRHNNNGNPSFDSHIQSLWSRRKPARN